MTDEFTVYMPWPTEVVNEAISEFNHQMHDGAGIEEISAGLHGLDFLTRASDLDDDTLARLEGAEIEARMRIELIALQEAEQRSADEQFERMKVGIKNLHRNVMSIKRRFIDSPPVDAQTLHEHVVRRVEKRIAS